MGPRDTWIRVGMDVDGVRRIGAPDRTESIWKGFANNRNLRGRMVAGDDPGDLIGHE